MIKKTLGGDRLGSGNRMKQEMHDFYRSNKNLSTSFYSTMTPGVLYPCYVSPALKADTFDIDLNAFARTIPTRGPLYGRYKLQIDFFQCPVRLYQAILHNNTTDIARKMVTQLGMSDILGPIVFGTGNEEVFLGKDFSNTRNFSEKVAAQIDDEIHRIVTDGYKLAEKLINEHMNEMHFIAEYLVANEMMDADQFLFDGEPTFEKLDNIKKEKEERSKEANRRRAEEAKAEAEVNNDDTAKNAVENNE